MRPHARRPGTSRSCLAVSGSHRAAALRSPSAAMPLSVALGADRVPYDGVVHADTLSAGDVRAWAKARWPAQLAHLPESDIRITVVRCQRITDDEGENGLPLMRMQPPTPTDFTRQDVCLELDIAGAALPPLPLPLPLPLPPLLVAAAAAAAPKDEEPFSAEQLAHIALAGGSTEPETHF